MERIGIMAFDNTRPTKKRLPQTILTSIEWVIHRASAAGLLCLMLSPSVQADQFQKIILYVSHPATSRVALKRIKLGKTVKIREKQMILLLSF
jgi:hypothetical protein